MTYELSTFFYLERKKFVFKTLLMNLGNPMLTFIIHPFVKILESKYVHTVFISRGSGKNENEMWSDLCHPAKVAGFGPRLK